MAEPVSNVNFTGGDDPVKTLQSILDKVQSYDIEAYFLPAGEDAKTAKKIDRVILESSIEDYCAATQNNQLLNKFLSIDGGLNQALRKYQAEIHMLLSSVLMMNNVNTAAQAQPMGGVSTQMPQTAAPQTVTPSVLQQVGPQPTSPADLSAEKAAPKNVGVE